MRLYSLGSHLQLLLLSLFYGGPFLVNGPNLFLAEDPQHAATGNALTEFSSKCFVTSYLMEGGVSPATTFHDISLSPIHVPPSPFSGSWQTTQYAARPPVIPPGARVSRPVSGNVPGLAPRCRPGRCR